MEIYRAKFYLSRNKNKLLRIFILLSIVIALMIFGILYINMNSQNNYATQKFIECNNNSLIYRDASGNIFDKIELNNQQVVYSRNNTAEFILIDNKIKTISIEEEKITLTDYQDLTNHNLININKFEVFNKYILVDNGQKYLINNETNSVSDITALTYKDIWIVDTYLYYLDNNNVIHILNIEATDFTNLDAITQTEIKLDFRKETVDIYQLNDTTIQLINKFGDGNKTNCLFTYEIGTNNLKGLQKLNIGTSYPLKFRNSEYTYGYIYQKGSLYYAKLINKENKESSKELQIKEYSEDMFLYEDILTYPEDNHIIMKVANKKTIIYKSEENCRMIIVV